MKIDILSDTHFDSWFGYPRTQKNSFKRCVPIFGFMGIIIPLMTTLVMINVLSPMR